MTVITTCLTVTPDGAISGRAPELPAGEHVARIEIRAPHPRLPGKPFTMDHFPVHDEPWDDSVSLRREDMYGDDGR